MRSSLRNLRCFSAFHRVTPPVCIYQDPYWIAYRLVYIYKHEYQRLLRQVMLRDSISATRGTLNTLPKCMAIELREMGQGRGLQKRRLPGGMGRLRVRKE